MSRSQAESGGEIKCFHFSDHHFFIRQHFMVRHALSLLTIAGEDGIAGDSVAAIFNLIKSNNLNMFKI